MDAGLSAASECPACFQELGDTRKPYSLPCGHTICQSCIQPLVRISSAQFGCPLCHLMIDKSSVKLNVALYKLLLQLRAGPLQHLPQALNIEFSDLEMGAMIDRGAFGEVCRAKWRGSEVAVKVLFAGQLSPEAHDAFKREVFVMNCLRHPNIVMLMAACPSPPRLAIVMEFMAGGSLYYLLHVQKHRLNIENLVSIATGICRGLQFLHFNNILHRDLKSKNVLLTGPLPCQAKLCDFGLARMKVESATMTGNIGTVHWTAPEVLNCSRYKFSADIYSFGMVLYELVTGMVPYAKKPPAMVIVSVLMKREQLKIVNPIHPKLEELFKSCTQWEAKDRPSIASILSSLATMLPKQEQKHQEEYQEDYSSYLSHTDSLGHVFLSIGEDDVDLIEMLQDDDFTHSISNSSTAGTESGLVSKSDLDQFFMQQQEPEEEEDDYLDDHYIKFSKLNSLHHPFKSSSLQKSSQNSSKKQKKRKTKTFVESSSSEDEEDADKILARKLAEGEEFQQQLADYHLAYQLQSKENNVLVPADQRPTPALPPSKAKYYSKAPMKSKLGSKPVSSPPPPPPPPPPVPNPSDRVSNSRPHHRTSKDILQNITAKDLFLTQVKKATSRLSKMKLNPVKTVEKRAFPVGHVVGGTNDGSYSVNRLVESFNKRWLRHVPNPKLSRSIYPVGRVLKGIQVKPIIKRLNSDVVDFNKSDLHHTSTVVRSSLPTKYDILSEKIQAMGVSEEMRPTLWRLNSEVRRFDQSSMNLVGTVEKNTLPTQEDIEAEKRMATSSDQQ